MHSSVTLGNRSATLSPRPLATTDSNNIIHHINANEFQNLRSNLVEISITEEELKHFGEDFTPFKKHAMIHRIFNTEYVMQFFDNCIALKPFNADPYTFYIDFIKNHINDPKKL